MLPQGARPAANPRKTMPTRSRPVAATVSDSAMPPYLSARRCCSGLASRNVGRRRTVRRVAPTASTASRPGVVAAAVVVAAPPADATRTGSAAGSSAATARPTRLRVPNASSPA